MADRGLNSRAARKLRVTTSLGRYRDGQGTLGTLQAGPHRDHMVLKFLFEMVDFLGAGVGLRTGLISNIIHNTYR